MVEKKSDATKEKEMPQPTAPASMGEEAAGLGVEAEAQKVEKAAQAAPPAAVAVTAKKEAKPANKVAEKFAADMGVDSKDIISVNENTNTVVTSQGSKYRLRGKRWMRLLGPDIDAVEEDEDEE